MGLYDNKWQRLKKVQRLCSVLSVLFWLLTALPYLMQMSNVAAVLFFVENNWLIPFNFLLAVGFTASDIIFGYKLKVHEDEKNPRVHRSPKGKKS